MAMEERTAGLFGTVDSRRTDPRTLLLEKVLSKLPREEQISRITEVLREAHKQDEKVIVLLGALEKLFENEDIAFRSHLREIYSALPVTTVIDEQWNSPDRNYLIPITGDAAPRLKIAILEEILQGWQWIKPNEDTEECFRFVCRAYTSARQRDRVQKGILELFREYLNEDEGVFGYYPGVRDEVSKKLDLWILQNETPNDIAVLLLHAQIRLGGVPAAREKLRLLQTKEDQTV